MLKDRVFKSQINSKYLGARKPKGLNRIAKIGYGHLCLMEENISFTVCDKSILTN
jgi:hypothetical protein